MVNGPNPQIVQFLSRNEMFIGVDPGSLARIASATVAKEYAPGRTIIQQGDEGSALFIVARGRVVVVVEDLELGTEQIVSELGELELFGEMSVLLDEPRNASVRALVQTTCVILSRDAFQRIVMALPQVGLTVARNLARRLAAQNRATGFQFVRVGDYPFDPELYGMFPEDMLVRYEAIPLQTDGHSLTIAMTRPFDQTALDTFRALAPGVKIQPVACAVDDYQSYLKDVVAPTLGRDAAAVGGRRPAQKHNYKAEQVQYVDPEPPSGGAQDLPGDAATRLFNELLVDAVNRGASDIHIEPSKDALRVRMRCDGRLVGYRRPFQRRFHAPLISRIKIIGGMDIAERRKPQDGRASFQIADKQIDTRINTLPTLYGEKIVLRVLDVGGGLLSLDKLILSKPLVALVRRAVSKSSGGVLIVGPTGSGKTTTLYSALDERNTQQTDISIVTVEDPVEYTLDGITQIQVSDVPGMGWAGVLRALLRQDPDVIMIGEMRDAETAQIALEGALTGHLVLTTLHADGAVEAATRLVEMGCPPYLVSSAIDLICAQRLLRRICPHCRVQHRYTDIVRMNLERAGVLPMTESEALFKGQGCPACQGEGYLGRAGCYEIMQLTEPVREGIGLGESEAVLRKIAVESKAMATFQQYAGFLLRNGMSTPSEVLRLFSVL